LDPHLKFEQGSSPNAEPPLLKEDPAELKEEPTAGALLKEPLLKEEEPPKSLDPVTIVWR
jgi:hypothetical protein